MTSSSLVGGIGLVYTRALAHTLCYKMRPVLALTGAVLFGHK